MENIPRVDTEGNPGTFDALPDSLKQTPQWICWRYGATTKPTGKRDKKPVNPHTEKLAKVNDPTTWGTFQEACAAWTQGRAAGIGFVFTADDDFVGIDLDGCRDPTTGVIAQWALDIVERFLSAYWEVSPSGTGLHAIMQGSLPPEGRRKGHIEVYDCLRFFTMTGAFYAGCLGVLADCTATLAVWHCEVFGKPSAQAAVATPSLNGNGHDQGFLGSDAELLATACLAKNGTKFKTLWAGNLGKHGSHSEADLALCTMLAFWCGGDAARIDQLFRQSGLMRDKWDEQHGKRTYGEMTIEKTLNGTAGAATSEEPRPLRRPLPPAPLYPVEALGMLAEPAQRLHEVIRAPLALCCQSVLAAATLAVQPFADVTIDGRSYPLSENFVTVGESGERKSAVDRQALAPHYEWQRTQNGAYEILRRDYEHDLLAYSKQRDADVKKAKTRDAKRQAMTDLGPAPEAPLIPHFLPNEPTYEGLVKLLAVGLPSVGIFSDEGGRMIGGFALSSEQQLKTLAGLSELWDGKPISRVRAGEGSSLLYGKRVSVHLMAQPVVTSELLSNRAAQGQGFLSRCLLAWPDTTAGTRLYNPVNLQEDATLQTYLERTSHILETPWPVASNAPVGGPFDPSNQGEQTPGQLKPRALPLSQDAEEVWRAFHDHVETALAPTRALDRIRAFGSKAAEHVLRLAGVLTLYADLNARTIERDTLENATILVNYYLSEALRLAEATQDDPDLILAERLLGWAQEQGPYVALADLYQRGPNSIRDATTARKITTILVLHGWFTPVVGGKEVDGKYRREVWAVTPKEL